MNDVQVLIDRQLGLYCRLNYDNVLKRLEVNSEDSFYGLQAANVAWTPFNYDQDPPIFACRFCEAPGFEHILALANEDGKVAIQDTTSVKTASAIESFQCHNNAVFDLAWMPGHMNFVTVSGDHTACLWDAGEGAPRRAVVFSSHSRSVKTAAFRPEEPALLATGARDGHILLWDLRAGTTPAQVVRPDDRLSSCHSSVGGRGSLPGSHGKRARAEPPRALSVTGLAFRDALTLLSAGECDGNIKAWDLRKTYAQYRREPLPARAIPYCGSSAKVGYTNLLVDASRTRLYASCMDDVIYCFNVSTYGALPERRYVGHENGTFYIKTCLSPDGTYLVSGSSDKNAYVWNVKGSEPVVKLVGHRAEVTCAAWSQRGDVKIVTCSDDARHKIWRVGREFRDGDVPTHAEGHAEAGARVPPHVPPAWGSLERTPCSAKRAATGSSGASSATGAKRARLAPARRTKRCLAPALEAAEDAESAVKRLRLDGEGALVVAGVKRSHEGMPTAAWRYESRAGTSCLPPTETYEQKDRHRVSASPESPKELRIISFSTPTKDLPDFVMNGEAPHLRLMSPAKKKPDTTDWLTRMVREKRGKPETGEKLTPTAPLSPKENFPPPRNSMSTDKTPKSNKKSRTLLKYFTVASKNK